MDERTVESTAGRVRPILALASAAWAMSTLVGAALQSWIFALINAFGLILGLSFYAALPKHPKLAAPAAHVLSVVIVISVFVVANLSGQTSSPALWYLSSLPVAMGYLLGRRPAAIWALIAIGVGLSVDVMRRFYPLAPQLKGGPTILLFNFVIVVTLTFALVDTAVRLNQRQLRALRQREGTIRELLAGLENQKEELLRARDQAIAASKAKTDFVATVSHEIRTPLNGVLGMAGLLLDEDLSSRQRDLVRTIRLSGDALLGVINDILDFSKIEADRLELETAPFDLREHVEDALDLFSAAAAKKRLELTTVMDEDVPHRLLGDGARVRQILVNLLGNAVKFTERGEITVTISARRSSRPGGGAEGVTEITCAVKDTGIGIPEDRRRMLFMPFTQVDTSATRRFGGTGLGLAISQRLAQAMGGGISVESIPGQGSTFLFTFRAEPHRGSDDALPRHLAMRVIGFVCERETTRTMLESLAHSLPADSISWGGSAAARADGMRCDVLVCEDKLYDAELRRAVETAGIPVLLLTAPAALLPDPLPPGVMRVLAKPIRRADFRRAFLAAIGNAPSDSASTPARLPSIAAELPLRVLVAEDNPINQRVALLLLERLGYRADVAGNGVEALDAVITRPYDLVLMDVRMPEMDGITATTRIKKELPPDRRPRVVAMTANATVEDREACRACGMEDFLSKPIRTADLIRVLRGTKQRTLPSTPPIPPPPTEPDLDLVAFGAVRELLSSQPGELRAMVESYLDAASEHLRSIQAALDSKDARTLEMEAHSFKGVSGQLGARRVMAVAARLEKVGAARDFENAAVLLTLLRSVHEASRQLLLAACDDEVPPSRVPIAPPPA
ncbi:MAG: response regulator [Polyangiaceae bacterium]|nr:response regulator [Polyangiaceae bacterium]